MRFSLIILFISFLGLSVSVAQNQNTTKISFDLLNESSVSIPLVIDGVMKPNLSPNSKSRVTCKVGTKVWTKGRKALLIIVTEEMAGQAFIVDELIKNLPNKKRREKSRP